MGDIDTMAGTGAGTGTGAASPLSDLAELIAIVERLRDPVSGCPWDLVQTHESLIPYVLEEAHEVADAIRQGDAIHQGDADPLCEELGDLLLQVVLHARIAEEAGRFDLAAIARAINAKMVRRHPHVFGPDQALDRPADAAAVRVSWEAIKLAEKQAAAAANPAAASPAAADANPTPTSPLSDQLTAKVRGQGALAGAMTISSRAAAAGFEWDDLAGVWAKVDEELDELRQALAQGDPAHAETELARWSNLDPEAGLAGTNRRFLDRFSRVEAALGGELGGRPLAELEAHWRQAKAQIRAEQAQGPNAQS
jgi:XTP/dITP diphosphohydrolase